MKREDYKTAEEYIAALEAEQTVLQAKIAAKSAGTLRFKITEKGGLSVYGLGRFPVTLYKSQWLKLFAGSEELLKFLEEHDSELSVKAAA